LIRSILGTALIVLLGATPAAAQPGPAAPTNLRCPGPDLSYDPLTQQIVSAWEEVVNYPVTLDDQGPFGVALDTSCNLYVADSANHRIAKISPNGDTLAQWGTDGRGVGQFHRPGAVALDTAGNIYVADSGNDRIVKLSPDGQVAATWGKCTPGVPPCSPSPGDGPAEFFGPNGIAVDGSGNVYVAESVNNRVQKLSSGGQSLARWGAHGTAPGQFDSPWAVTLDAAGNIYVSDLNNNRIEKLSPSGDPLLQFGGTPGADAGEMKQPRGVAVDAQGNVYVADTQNHRIEQFAADGSFTGQWRRCEDGPDPCQIPNSGKGPGEFFYPRGLVADDAGQLYVADTSNNRVQRLKLMVVLLPDPASD